MVEFPPTVSKRTQKIVRHLFEQKTNKPWKQVGLMNVKVDEQPYQIKGIDYISHNIVFEMFGQDLKHMVSITEKDVRKLLKNLPKNPAAKTA